MLTFTVSHKHDTQHHLYKLFTTQNMSKYCLVAKGATDYHFHLFNHIIKPPCEFAVKGNARTHSMAVESM